MEEISDARDGSDMFRGRRNLRFLICALFLVALYSQHPRGVPLYAAPLDDRSLPSVEESLQKEGISYWYSDGRLTISEESLLEAKVVLLRRGLPEFGAADRVTILPHSEKLNQISGEGKSCEAILKRLDAVEDCRVDYACGKCHYIWPEDHTCERVYARILVIPGSYLTPEEHLGILSLLAHSTRGLEMVGFCVVRLDSQGGAICYHYSFDLRKIDRFDLSKAEYDFME